MCGKHILELYTVYLTRFQTYKIALPPQTKTNKEGRGPQTDKPAAKSLHRLIFKKSRHLELESIIYLVQWEGGMALHLYLCKSLDSAKSCLEYCKRLVG